MKPFQIIVLAVFGVLALVGLLVFATSKGIGGAKSANIGTVLIWGTLPRDSIDAALGDLSTSDKRFNGLSYVEKPEASFDADLASAIAEGRGPDLVLITQEQLLAERNRLSLIPFSSISERTYVDSYVPMSELFLTADGTYGIPFLIDPLVLYYNRPMLAGAGQSGAPSNWEAVNGLTQTLTRVTPGQQLITRSIIAFGDYANVANARAVLSLLLFQAGTPITNTGADGTPASALAQTTQSGALLAEPAVSFYTQFANPAKTVYSWNRSLPLSTDAFTAGDLALYPGFASERPLLAAANPNLDFDMAPMPQPATNQNPMTYGLLYAFAVPKASANPAGALSTAFTLSGTPSAAIASELSMAPAARALLTPRANDRYVAVFYPQALVARGWLSPLPSIVDGIFSGMIRDVISGKSEAPAAVRAADQSLDAALP